ncbi:MAG: hypothetical protein ACUVWO_02615 [Thermodesulfobacteriota bacterium]
MKGLKMILKVILFASLLLCSSSAVSYGQEVPAPFDRIKELAITQGQKNDDGAFMWEKTVESVEYWMVYSPIDESIGCGQRTDSGSYGWGIAYGLKGDFQFVEARMGQIVNFLLIEQESAIEIVNQFFKQVETLIENLKDSPAGGKSVRI